MALFQVYFNKYIKTFSVYKTFSLHSFSKAFTAK